MSDAEPRDSDAPSTGEPEGTAEDRDAARHAIDEVEQPDEPDGEAMSGEAPTG